jgi:hypothetical protein
MQIIFFIIFSLVESKLIVVKDIINAIDCGGASKIHSSYGIYFKPVNILEILERIKTLVKVISKII